MWLHEGRVLSVCCAVAVTEGYWDVGIETFEGSRRRGCARACYETLDRFMAKRGKQPVWGATVENVGSMATARCLGFVPVARLAVLEAVQTQSSLRDS